MVDVVTKSAELSQQAQAQGVQTYYYDPYSGTLITASPEGGVLVQVQGQTVSSKTGTQVSLEQQIQQAGGTVTHDVSEQIAIGLQEQTKTALAGKQPQPFEISTSEFRAKLTGGITPQALAGATGSVIPKGYTMTETGAVVPVAQKFRTSSGTEFIAEPVGTAKAGGFLWSTPYGQVRATPERLETEIERQMDVTAIFEQSKQQMLERQMIEKESRTLPARLEFGLEHPTKGLEYMIGSTMLYGNPLDIRGIEKYEKEREMWMESLMKTPPSERWKFAVAGMFEPVTMVAGAKALSMIPGLAGTKIGAKIISVPMAKEVLTGAGLGVTTGLTFIGTAESYKAYQRKEPGELGRGVLIAGAGALGTKAIWGAGVEPLLKEFYIVRHTTKGVSVSRILEKTDDAFAGKGQALYDTKVSGKEIVSKVEYGFVGKKVNERMTAEIGFGESKSVEVGQDLFMRPKGTALPNQYFVSEQVTVPAPKQDFFVSAFQTKTGLSVEKISTGTKEVGLTISKKVFQDEFKTVFKTAGKTPVRDLISTDIVIDTTKLPKETFFGGTSTGLTETFSPGGLEIVKAVQKDVLGMHTKAVLEFIDQPKQPDILPTIIGLGSRAEVGTKEDLLKITAPKSDVTQVQLERGETDLMIPPASMEITGVFEKPKEREDVFNISLTGIGTAQKQAELQELESLSLSRLDTFESISPPHPTVEPILTPGGGFGFPGFDFDFGETPGRKGKGVSREFAETPSFIATELDIHGKMPKRLTGLEIRPITGKRTKGKRRNDFWIDF